MCREGYAQRLVTMEAAVLKSESAAQSAATGSQQLIQALVERMAALLAGRLAVAHGLPTVPSQQHSCASPRPPTPTKRAATAAAAAGNTQVGWEVADIRRDKLLQ